ncbi:MAG: hypothetical protein WA890_27290, partial [Micromonospora sp.]
MTSIEDAEGAAMALIDTAPPRAPQTARKVPGPRSAGLFPADCLAWVGGLTTAAWARYEFDLTVGQFLRAVQVGLA